MNWIPAELRKPALFQRVLVYDPTIPKFKTVKGGIRSFNDVDIGYYRGEDDWVSPWFVPNGTTPTHWMPLPDYPTPPDYWKDWIAVLREEDEDEQYWCIAPKDFWAEHHHIPDSYLSLVPDGFFETREHTLDSIESLPKQEQALRQLGFTIVRWPQ